ITVGTDETETYSRNHTQKVGDNQAIEVAKDGTYAIGENRATTVGKDDELKVGKTLSITAADSITLKTGSASITMQKNGDIVIAGRNITITGSGEIVGKASKNMTLKAKKILQN